nr:hypothetical protein [uncultured Roseovarius sp.]
MFEKIDVSDIKPTRAEIDDLFQKWKYAEHMAGQAERVNSVRAAHGQQTTDHAAEEAKKAFERYRDAGNARHAAISARKATA